MADEMTGLNGQDSVVEPQEKMIPQSKVDEIVHQRTSAVAQKARQQALEEAARNHAAQSNQSMGGMSQMSPEDIHSLVARKTQEELNKYQQKYLQDAQEQEGRRVVSEFHSRIAAGKDKYPDLDKKVSELGLANYPQVVHMATNLDNTADVMHELSENPTKLASLHILALTNPELAHREIGRLSSSIKLNQAASNVKTASDPLSQVTPSTVGTDNGSMSVGDYRKQSWLKA